MLLTATATLTATAQQYSYAFGGLLADRDRLSTADIFSLANYESGFGTARSMAMAGAFTSLGADLTSISLNPAGLGMYRGSEVALTPMVTFTSATNNSPVNLSNSTSRFALGSTGVVFNAYEGTGSVLSVNIGLGYNRIADYNSQYSFVRGNSPSTLAGMFARQLDAYGIGINSSGRIADIYNGREYTDFDLSSRLWGGVLAYKCGLLNKFGDAWGLDEYPQSFTTDQYTTVTSRGSAGEYSFAFGMNISNKFYVGASLGLLHISRKTTVSYGENIYPDGNVDPAATPYLMRYFDYAQWSEVSGTGVNFKIGFTWRPIDALRIGVALHTPTYYSLDFSYGAGMDSASESIGSNPGGYQLENGFVYASEGTPRIEDRGADSWEMSSPTRLMFGVSYTIGKSSIVSVDYERDWYNGIRMSNMPYVFSTSDYNSYFSAAFKGSNTLRIGLETKVTPRLSLRAGYGYNGSMLRGSSSDDELYASPVVYASNIYTAGIGFAISPRVSLDAAYQYVSSRLTDYRLFYAYAYDAGNIYVDSASDYSGLCSTKLARSNVALTLGIKF